MNIKCAIKSQLMSRKRFVMFLKEFREKTGLSQKDFTEKLGSTQVTISRYETDKMNPTSTVIQKYISVFKANPNYLFLGLEPHILDDVPKYKNKLKIEDYEYSISN